MHDYYCKVNIVSGEMSETAEITRSFPVPVTD